MTTDPKQPEAQEAPASAWDERMQFEKWAKKEFGQGQVTRANTEVYVWDHVEDAWRTWRARAALGKQPTQEADAWKKAVDDELALCESTASSFPDARAAVRGLIDWHVRNAK